MSIQTFVNKISDKDHVLTALERRGLIPRMSDEEYIRRMWRVRMGYELDLENPRTFNEKLQWLKLYDRNPLYTTMVDKVAAKDYVAGIIGEEHIIPTLGVWNDPDEIDFDALPEQFVLKCNHNSGLGMCICKDKSKLDIKRVKAELRKGLKQDYYLGGREWPYKNVPRKILAEQYMEDEVQEGLIDYKFYCFNGEPRLVHVHFDRFTAHGANAYTVDWRLLSVDITEKSNPVKYIDCPAGLKDMVQCARELSENIPFVRVDFYSICNRVYFGELTFFPDSGYCSFSPPEWDYKMGDWITLPEKRSAKNG